MTSPRINAGHTNLKIDPALINTPEKRSQAQILKENSKIEKLGVGKVGLPPLFIPTELSLNQAGASHPSQP
jgi:hypothetical protein